jgi:hypothetical protein
LDIAALISMFSTRSCFPQKTPLPDHAASSLRGLSTRVLTCEDQKITRWPALKIFHQVRQPASIPPPYILFLSFCTLHFAINTNSIFCIFCQTRTGMDHYVRLCLFVEKRMDGELVYRYGPIACAAMCVI